MSFASFKFAASRQIDSINKCMQSGWDLYLSQLRLGDEFSLCYWVRMEKLIDTIEIIASGNVEVSAHMCSVIMTAQDILLALERAVCDQQTYYENITSLISDLSAKLVSINRTEEPSIDESVRSLILDSLSQIQANASLARESVVSIRSNRHIIDEYRSVLTQAMRVADLQIDIETMVV